MSNGAVLSEVFNTNAVAMPRHFTTPHHDLDFLSTPFGRVLRANFGTDTTLAVKTALEDLQLPLPVVDEEFLNATEGAIVFLDRYGIVLRIEDKDSEYIRIDDSALIVRPIAVIDAGNALIEICPGCKTVTERDVINHLHKKLLEEDVHLWDNQTDNIGLLPLKTEDYPQGIPVVIDRLAVQRVSIGTAAATRAMNAEPTAALLKAEAEYYQPFIDHFRAAWPLTDVKPDAQKMTDFWGFCENQAKAGQLVAGWRTNEDTQSSKARSVAGIGRNYNQLFTAR